MADSCKLDADYEIIMIANDKERGETQVWGEQELPLTDCHEKLEKRKKTLRCGNASVCDVEALYAPTSLPSQRYIFTVYDIFLILKSVTKKKSNSSLKPHYFVSSVIIWP